MSRAVLTIIKTLLGAIGNGAVAIYSGYKAFSRGLEGFGCDIFVTYAGRHFTNWEPPSNMYVAIRINETTGGQFHHVKIHDIRIDRHVYQ